MKKLLLLLVGFLLAELTAATPNPPPDARVERIVERLSKDSELFGLQAPTGIIQASLIDFAGVGTGLSGCPPAGKARAFYDVGDNTFKVLDSGCTNIISGGGTGTTPRLDQVLDQNQNKTFNQGGATIGFGNGPGLDLSSETSPINIPLIANCTTNATGQLCFDTVGVNIHGFDGLDSILPAFDPASVTSGNLVGFLNVGGHWTLQDLGPPSATGGTVITADITNVREGDTLCWDSTLATPSFVNCAAGVPINLQTGTTYTFDGLADRGTAIISSNTNPQTYSLAAITDAGDFDASWFVFQHNKNSGLITVQTTAPSTFDDTGTQSTTLEEGQACTFLTDTTGNGTLYPKCHEPRMTATAPIVFTRSAYGLGISCPSCGVGTGNLSGALSAGKVPVASSAITLIDGSILDDLTHAARNDNGYDINSLGKFMWWIPNNASTGTTLNKAICDDGANKGIICPFATSTTNNVLGSAVAANGAAPGTTGSTGVCTIGFCSWIMDNAATAGHYAQSSSVAAGELADVGATPPTNGQSYWYIFTGNAGPGTAAVIRNSTAAELNASSISGGNGRNIQVQVNGTATTKSIKNFNSSTPAPGAGFLATTPATSSSGNVDSIIHKIPISGNTATVASAGTLSGAAANVCTDGSGNLVVAGCPSAGGVTSLTGDGSGYNNSASTGAVTLTKASQNPNLFAAGPSSSSASNLVQSNSAFAGSNATVAYSTTPATGSLLVVVTVNDVSNVTTISGGGNTWSKAATSTAGQLRTDIFYTCNASGSATTVTPTFPGGTVITMVQVYEYSGNPTTSCLDTTGVAGINTPGVATQSVTTGGTVAQSTELVFASCTVLFSGGTTLTVPSTYSTLIDTISGNSNQLTAQLNASTGLSGTQSITCTAGVSNSAFLGAMIATFKLNTSGSAPWTFRTIVSGDLPSATTSLPGVVQLTNGLGGTAASPTLHTKHGLSFSIGDPAGSALTAGSTTTDYITVPFACTINAYNLNIDAGTITVKFWKIATGTAIPTSANSINTSGVGISSGTAIHSTTLSDFTTTTVAANDIMAVNITAVATAKFLNAVLSCTE